MKKQDTLQAYLLRAQESEHGISILTNSPTRLQNRLAYQQFLHKPRFSNLSIHMSPDRKRIWVLKNSENPNATERTPDGAGGASDTEALLGRRGGTSPALPEVGTERERQEDPPESTQPNPRGS